MAIPLPWPWCWAGRKVSAACAAVSHAGPCCPCPLRSVRSEIRSPRGRAGAQLCFPKGPAFRDLGQLGDGLSVWPLPPCRLPPALTTPRTAHRSRGDPLAGAHRPPAWPLSAFSGSSSVSGLRRWPGPGRAGGPSPHSAPCLLRVFHFLVHAFTRFSAVSFTNSSVYPHTL